MTKIRCIWCKDDPLYSTYHDTEWGVPEYNDIKLFEILLLESMQAGLSWITILRKRECFRAAFDQFNPEKIARYTAKQIQKLLSNPGIIRHPKKINAAITNARCFLKLQEQHDSFMNYIWQFTNGKVLQNNWRKHEQIPALSKESDAMAKELKKQGFSFVGSTTCYAYMQATGMVNDHVTRCFRHKELC